MSQITNCVVSLRGDALQKIEFLTHHVTAVGRTAQLPALCLMSHTACCMWTATACMQSAPPMQVRFLCSVCTTVSCHCLVIVSRTVLLELMPG